MHALNKELAKIFEEIGCIYEFLGANNRFRAIAYHNAAKALEDFTEDLNHHIHDGKLDKVHGIGKGMEEKILEFVRTGKMEKYELLRKKIPHDFIELLHVQGFGPETLKRFYEELNLKTKEEIVQALEDGRISKLKGFKKKKIDNLLESLKQKNESETRALLWDALDISETFIARLKAFPEVIKIEVAGSVRRMKETIGDIDILVAAKKSDRKKIIRKFVEMEDITKVFAEGDTKASVFVAHFNRQVDIRIINEDEWGAALQYFTGSKAHNIHLRKIAIDKGLKINEYGLFDVKTGNKIAGDSEEGIYHALDLVMVPPEMREDHGEIELAMSGKMPSLISLKDIKGDMHSHSNWSDGTSSLEEIVEYVQKHFNYEYLVLSDHSKSERVAGGMDESEFRKQIKKIREINKRLGADFLKAGAEVDILPDGSLDLSDHLLEQLDWVIASVHSQFKKDNTDRIIKACENPYVHVIGHPTGRQLGIREAYPVNMEAVIEAAASTGTALEINGHAYRMDLNDQWAKLAREKGVRLTIGTDSHNPANYHYMKLGVAIARRAWCASKHILNTHSWNKIESFKKNKRKAMV